MIWVWESKKVYIDKKKNVFNLVYTYIFYE